MFNPLITHEVPNCRRPSVPLFPKRDTSNDRRLTQAGIDDTKRTKIDPEIKAAIEKENAAKKAAEKKQEAPQLADMPEAFGWVKIAGKAWTRSGQKLYQHPSKLMWNIANDRNDYDWREDLRDFEPKPAPISGSLVGKMMKIADMPVGTKYSSGQHQWVKISAEFIRSTGYGSLILIVNCPGDREVIADPVVEIGDKVTCVCGAFGIVTEHCDLKHGAGVILDNNFDKGYEVDSIIQKASKK